MPTNVYHAVIKPPSTRSKLTNNTALLKTTASANTPSSPTHIIEQLKILSKFLSPTICLWHRSLLNSSQMYNTQKSLAPTKTCNLSSSLNLLIHLQILLPSEISTYTIQISFDSMTTTPSPLISIKTLTRISDGRRLTLDIRLNPIVRSENLKSETITSCKHFKRTKKSWNLITLTLVSNIFHWMD